MHRILVSDGGVGPAGVVVAPSERCWAGAKLRGGGDRPRIGLADPDANASGGRQGETPMNETRVAARCFGAAAIMALIHQPVALADSDLAEKLAAGVWRSLVDGGTNEYDFPLTPLGQSRFDSYRLDQDSSLRCEPPGMPRAFYNLSPMAFRFEGDTVTILYETMDVVRTVRLDGEPLPQSEGHTPNGHAIGRFEGDALVVDTTHLTAGETTRDGVPKSALMTLRETFRVEDRGDVPHLIVTVTITDAENFREPFSTVNEFALEPDWELLPFDCHPTEYAP